MLQAGTAGPFAFLLTAVTAKDGLPNEAAYFWLTGFCRPFSTTRRPIWSFSNSRAATPAKLMGPLAGTLAAISMGAVYMGALTYIGNAPNFMIYAIADENGVEMPSFFAYLFWAALILVPLFVLLTLLPVSPILRICRSDATGGGG